MKVLLDEAQIREGVEKLAATVNERRAGSPLTIVGIMTGSLMFLADLVRLLEMPMRVGVVQASSYRQGTERGPLSINADMMPDIKGRDLLLLDDIFDTGHTLTEVLKLIEALEPNSVESAVLLRKQGRQQVELEPNYAVFEIPDEFVVGYGLDYCDEYRNLPYLAVLSAAETRVSN